MTIYFAVHRYFESTTNFYIILILAKSSPNLCQLIISTALKVHVLIAFISELLREFYCGLATLLVLH
jgi:hypothetical protein